PHRPGGGGVVARRPHGTEGAVGLPGVQRLDRRETRAGGEERRVVRPLVGGRVGIEPPAAAEARLLDHRHQRTVVHPRQLVDGGGTGDRQRDRLAQPSGLDAGQDGPEPVRALRVPAPEVVLQVALVGEEEGGHDLVTLGRPSTVAPMTGDRLLPGTDARLRISPWRGDPQIAHLAPGRGRPTTASVTRALDELASSGCTSVLTGALAGPDQLPFLHAGFEVHERLHLLVRTLDDLPASAAADLRRGPHADRPAVLPVDAA